MSINEIKIIEMLGVFRVELNTLLGGELFNTTRQKDLIDFLDGLEEDAETELETIRNKKAELKKRLKEIDGTEKEMRIL